MKRKRRHTTARGSQRPAPAASTAARWLDRPLAPTLTVAGIALLTAAVCAGPLASAPMFRWLLGDAAQYDNWAREIAAGNWIGDETFYQAPLYPYLLAVIYIVGYPSATVVRVVQAMLFAGACGLITLAGRRWHDGRTGFIAGLLLATQASAIFFVMLLQKSAVDLFLMCALVYMLARLQDEPASRRWSIWCGVTCGTLALVRENALIMPPVIAVWLAVVQRSAAWGARLKSPALVFGGLLIVLLPVAARNAHVGGTWRLTTSQMGPNFFIGNALASDGTYRPLRSSRGNAFFEQTDARELAESAEGRRLTSGEVDQYWLSRAGEEIASDPGHWLWLIARKFALVANAVEVADTEDIYAAGDVSPPLRFLSFVAHFGVLAPLAAWGIVVTWDRRQRLVILYALTIAYALSVVAFFVLARYRFPLVPLLVLPAAAGLRYGPRWIATHSSRAILSAVALALAVGVFSNWPILSRDAQRSITYFNVGVAAEAEDAVLAEELYLRSILLDPQHANPRNNLALLLHEQGRSEEALAELDRALAISPTTTEALVNRAHILRSTGKLDEALATLRRALTFSPRDALAHSNLGETLFQAGDVPGAIAELRAALALDPDLAPAHVNLATAFAKQGNLAEALAHAQQAVAADPRLAESHQALASLLIQSDRLAEAVAPLEQAAQIRPDDVRTHVTLASVLSRLGRRDEALRQAALARALIPPGSPQRGSLEQALQALGL